MNFVFQMDSTTNTKQLNPFVLPPDRGTVRADSTHDETNPLLRKTATHDDDILSQTCLIDSDCTQAGAVIVPTGNQSIYQNGTVYTGEDKAPTVGYIPYGDNFCYVFDSHEGSVLKGIHCIFDSASTPSFTEFIDNMITVVQNNNPGIYPTLNYNTATGLTKTEKDKVYKFVLFNSVLNGNPGVPAHNLDYSAFTNYDILLFVTAMCTLGFDKGDVLSFINMLFLDSWNTDAQKWNRYKIITLVNANFLWQNNMNYCYSLTSEEEDKKAILALKNLRFTDVKQEPGKNLNTLMYCIGYDPLPDDANISMFIRELSSFSNRVSILDTNDKVYRGANEGYVAAGVASAAQYGIDASTAYKADMTNYGYTAFLTNPDFMIPVSTGIQAAISSDPNLKSLVDSINSFTNSLESMTHFISAIPVSVFDTTTPFSTILSEILLKTKDFIELLKSYVGSSDYKDADEEQIIEAVKEYENELANPGTNDLAFGDALSYVQKVLKYSYDNKSTFTEQSLAILSKEVARFKELFTTNPEYISSILQLNPNAIYIIAVYFVTSTGELPGLSIVQINAHMSGLFGSSSGVENNELTTKAMNGAVAIAASYLKGIGITVQSTYSIGNSYAFGQEMYNTVLATPADSATSNYGAISYNAFVSRVVAPINSLLPIPLFSELDSNSTDTFIEAVATIMYHLSFKNKQDVLVIPNIPKKTDEYAFFTSQRMCAKEIKKHIPQDKVKNVKARGKDEGNSDSKNELKSMLAGLDALFKLLNATGTTINKAYLYQILKFQGDTGHLIFSILIQEAIKNYKIALNKNYKFEDADFPTPIEIRILTGERPLMVRAVLEKVDAQSKTFKIFKTITGTVKPEVLHVADPCLSLNKTRLLFNNLINLPLPPDPGVPPDPEVSLIYGNLQSLDTALIGDIKTLLVPPLLVGPNRSLYDYINGLDFMVQVDCSQYIDDKIYESKLTPNLRTSVLGYLNTKQTLIELIRLFNNERSFFRDVDALSTCGIGTGRRDNFALLRNKDTFKKHNARWNDVVEFIEDFYNLFNIDYKRDGDPIFSNKILNDYLKGLALDARNAALIQAFKAKHNQIRTKLLELQGLISSLLDVFYSDTPEKSFLLEKMPNGYRVILGIISVREPICKRSWSEDDNNNDLLLEELTQFLTKTWLKNPDAPDNKTYTAIIKHIVYLTKILYTMTFVPNPYTKTISENHEIYEMINKWCGMMSSLQECQLTRTTNPVNPSPPGALVNNSGYYKIELLDQLSKVKSIVSNLPFFMNESLYRQSDFTFTDLTIPYEADNYFKIASKRIWDDLGVLDYAAGDKKQYLKNIFRFFVRYILAIIHGNKDYANSMIIEATLVAANNTKTKLQELYDASLSLKTKIDGGDLNVQSELDQSENCLQDANEAYEDLKNTLDNYEVATGDPVQSMLRYIRETENLLKNTTAYKQETNAAILAADLVRAKDQVNLHVQETQKSSNKINEVLLAANAAKTMFNAIPFSPSYDNKLDGLIEKIKIFPGNPFIEYDAIKNALLVVPIPNPFNGPMGLDRQECMILTNCCRVGTVANITIKNICDKKLERFISQLHRAHISFANTLVDTGPIQGRYIVGGKTLKKDMVKTQKKRHNHTFKQITGGENNFYVRIKSLYDSGGLDVIFGKPKTEHQFLVTLHAIMNNEEYDSVISIYLKALFLYDINSAINLLRNYLFMCDSVRNIKSHASSIIQKVESYMLLDLDTDFFEEYLKNGRREDKINFVELFEYFGNLPLFGRSSQMYKLFFYLDKNYRGATRAALALAAAPGAELAEDYIPYSTPYEQLTFEQLTAFKAKLNVPENKKRIFKELLILNIPMFNYLKNVYYKPLAPIPVPIDFGPLYLTNCLGDTISVYYGKVKKYDYNTLSYLCNFRNTSYLLEPYYFNLWKDSLKNITRDSVLDAILFLPGILIERDFNNPRYTPGTDPTSQRDFELSKKTIYKTYYFYDFILAMFHHFDLLLDTNTEENYLAEYDFERIYHTTSIILDP